MYSKILLYCLGEVKMVNVALFLLRVGAECCAYPVLLCKQWKTAECIMVVNVAQDDN